MSGSHVRISCQDLMSGSDVHFSVGFPIFTVKYFSIFGNLYFSLPGASGKKESSAFIKLDYLLTFEVLVVQKLTDCHLPNLPEEGAPDHVIKTHLQTNVARPRLSTGIYRTGNCRPPPPPP